MKPTALHIVPRVTGRPRPDGRRGVVVTCPYCGRQHAHSGPGHRMAHCANEQRQWGFLRGYKIVAGRRAET